MKLISKRILYILGVITLVFSVWYLWSIYTWPENPSNEEQQAQWEFEQKCFKDSTGIISPKEKMLCDSMLNAGYLRFEIIHKYYYTPCKQLKNYNRCVFILNYQLKLNGVQPETNEINKNAMNLTKFVINRYLENDVLASFSDFEVQGVIGNEGGGVMDESEFVYKSCGFKLVSIGKNKWKRLPI